MRYIKYLDFSIKSEYFIQNHFIMKKINKTNKKKAPKNISKAKSILKISKKMGFAAHCGPERC
jgi:hypothetical protein